MAPRSIFWRVGTGKAGSGLQALQLLYYNNFLVSRTILRFFIKPYRIIVAGTGNGYRKQHPAEFPAPCSKRVWILPENMGKSERIHGDRSKKRRKSVRETDPKSNEFSISTKIGLSFRAIYEVKTIKLFAKYVGYLMKYSPRSSKIKSRWGGQPHR